VKSVKHWFVSLVRTDTRPEKELSRRAKGDKGKVRLARQLRAETTMTLGWIARRLQMGSWTYVSNLLREKP
jgi:hypothetical protein